MSCQKKYTCVSAPGKVLLVGGYLVLEKKHSGLVVATDSKFYTTITSSDNKSNFPVVLIRSPQFLDGAWDYNVEERDNEWRLNQFRGSKNGYVEVTLFHTLNVISLLSPHFKEVLGNGINVIILGHNDFYSHREELLSRKLPITTQSLSSLPAFAPTNTKISQVHKTGLGSSAAMITSLVGALLTHFSIPTETESANKSLLHNLAQFCHCLAQGKIGSGFDVSSACFGSHMYSRFSPSILNPIMSESNAVGTKEILDVLQSNSWDNVVEKVSLPHGIYLKLADIDAGSSTPKLVSGVLKWKKENPLEAEELWNDLDAKNTAFIETLKSLDAFAKRDIKSYQRGLDLCQETVASEWKQIISDGETSKVVSLLFSAHRYFQEIRSLLRKMSTLANVPIEPEEQTQLLEATQSVPGVILAGVPGAGGFDAISCLCIGTKSLQEIENIWADWKIGSVGPLLAGANTGTAEEPESGFRKETLENISGLKEIVNGVRFD